MTIIVALAVSLVVVVLLTILFRAGTTFREMMESDEWENSSGEFRD